MNDSFKKTAKQHHHRASKWRELSEQYHQFFHEIHLYNIGYACIEAVILTIVLFIFICLIKIILFVI